MNVNPDDLLTESIIGLQAKILESPDKTLQGVGGTVVFETKNMILLRKDSIIRQMAKSVATRIEIQTCRCACFISGSALIGRPEDRISRLNNG